MLDKSECLLCALLEHHEQWLPWYDTSTFWSFLWGANYRANITDVHFPDWRIMGPLEQPDFFDHYFGNENFIGQRHHMSPRDRWRHWEQTDIRNPRFEETLNSWFEHDLVENNAIHRAQHTGFLSIFATRPSMFLHTTTSQSIYAFLVGMTLGGDWLGLPAYKDAMKVVEAVELESLKQTGSKFDLYKKQRLNTDTITNIIIREVGEMPTIGSTTTR